MGEVTYDEPVGSAEESGFGQDEVLFEAPVTASTAEVARPAAPLALYRRYRPDTFADVIGQDHVTEPLQRALTRNRVHHAYLFSGPRGCGKTTSARILARALNCEKGPAAEPCGVCDSCRGLARGGPGSIDVIEIDAASHGGVDDARDLRERAFFAPVSSRYKIYVIDEAHMVTTAGFNALLKLVEEPPPHVKFIFATTEPDKVIGTIRSRTHHYPFRLVPPRTLGAYLAKLCEAEGIAVEPAVIPLVVRAGAGSVRDSLSVLDQLLGAADDSGVPYAHAVALLGYTPDSLLDEVVDAFAAGDAGGVFACVDKVVEVGQDPRRFAEDLLRRLRDLVIVAAVPDALTSGLVDVAPDQAQRLSSQAAALGPGELTRAAEVIATGLTDMRGTTAPRLHLELMCARVLLPGADVDDRGVHARLDRLERRIGMVGATPPPAAAPEPTRPSAEERPPAQGPAAAPAGSATPEPVLEASSDAPSTSSGSGGTGSGSGGTGLESVPEPAPHPGLSTTDVRRLWPEVLEEVKRARRFTWILLSQNASVAEVRDGTLLLAMGGVGARDSFAKGGSEDVLREALVVVLGADLKIQTMVDPGAGGARGEPSRRTSVPDPVGPSTSSSAAGGEPDDTAAPSTPAVTPPTPDPALRQQAREQIRPTRQGGPADQPEDDRDAAASRDDTEVAEEDQSHAGLLARHLGAQVIEEETHDA